MLQVAACNAERGCGAAAMLKVIVSSSLDFFDGNCVFIFNFYHYHTVIVQFPSNRAHLLQSLAMLIQFLFV